ncbi:MAG: hypothetical protein H5U40_15225 [Polyangiaceae bacterium]|nr:hypothetical protein [Polyangiaceae bacterium]
MGNDAYVAPFGDALAEMTVAQLNIAASVDHLVPVGAKFDWKLWRERWKRLPGSHDPSWLDFMRGGRHPTRLELRRAAQRLQRELATKLEVEVEWNEDAVFPTGPDHDLEDRVPRVGTLGLRRLALLAGEEDAPSREAIERALDEDAPMEIAECAALHDPAHPFVQLLHLDAGNLLVPVAFRCVLQGIPWTIGSAPVLLDELDRIAAILGPIETIRGRDDQLFEIVRALRTLERLARRAVELRLPLFIDS